MLVIKKLFLNSLFWFFLKAKKVSDIETMIIIKTVKEVIGITAAKQTSKKTAKSNEKIVFL